MIISIAGPAGSGKSTIAKMLAEKLGWKRYYMGGLRREKALARGMTLDEYNKLGETDSSTDVEVDEYQRQLGQTEDNFIIEGRTSWYFIPHSLKIYIDVNEEEGAKRVFSDLQKDNSRNEGKNLNSVEAVLQSHRQRKQSDQTRYQKYFGIDAYDKSHFDLVVDTTDLPKEESFKKVWEFVEAKMI